MQHEKFLSFITDWNHSTQQYEEIYFFKGLSFDGSEVINFNLEIARANILNYN